MSLFALFAAAWGLHLRLKDAQAHWKEEAVMVRRRSMALSAAGALGDESRSTLNSLGVHVEKGGHNGTSARWSDVPEYNRGQAIPGYRGSMVKDPNYDDEERLDRELNLAKRNSRDQEMMVRRAS